MNTATNPRTTHTGTDAVGTPERVTPGPLEARQPATAACRRHAGQ